MEMKETNLAGCLEITNSIFTDQRGRFIKTFHEEIFQKHNLSVYFSEEYYSVSKKHVIRGLHFQKPPTDHDKIVYCVSGEVLDIVVDLRKNSPTYGQFICILLSGTKANMLYIPRGMAHGFEVLSEEATMMYKVTSIYSAQHDSGILWSSLGIPWKSKNPILSERDKSFVPFSDFISPF